MLSVLNCICLQDYVYIVYPILRYFKLSKDILKCLKNFTNFVLEQNFFFSKKKCRNKVKNYTSTGD